MGSHIDTRIKARKSGKQVLEDRDARRRRASFKTYLLQLEEELLEQEAQEAEPLDDDETEN